LTFETGGGVDAKSQEGQIDPWTSHYTLKLEDTLWSPDNNWWTYKAGLLNEKQAELAFRSNRDQLALNLIQKIYDHLVINFQLEINRQILKWIQTEYAIIQQSYKQGLKSYSDFLRFKGRFLNAQLTVNNLEVDSQKSLVDVAVILDMRDELTSVQDDLASLEKPVGAAESPEGLITIALTQLQKQLGARRNRRKD
jgi:outer membrane protein TolC